MKTHTSWLRRYTNIEGMTPEAFALLGMLAERSFEGELYAWPLTEVEQMLCDISGRELSDAELLAIYGPLIDAGAVIVAIPKSAAGPVYDHGVYIYLSKIFENATPDNRECGVCLAGDGHGTADDVALAFMYGFGLHPANVDEELVSHVVTKARNVFRNIGRTEISRGFLRFRRHPRESMSEAWDRFVYEIREPLHAKASADCTDY